MVKGENSTHENARIVFVRYIVYLIGYSDLQALLAYKKEWAYDLLEAKIKEDIEEVTMNIHDESDYFKPLTDRIRAAFKKGWEDLFNS